MGKNTKTLTYTFCWSFLPVSLLSAEAFAGCSAEEIGEMVRSGLSAEEVGRICSDNIEEAASDSDAAEEEKVLDAETGQEINIHIENIQHAPEAKKEASKAESQAVESGNQGEIKHYKLGLSSHFSEIVFEDIDGVYPWNEFGDPNEWTFTGVAISGSYAFNDNVSIRGLLSQQMDENEGRDGWEITMQSFQIEFILGRGLTTPGWNWFGSLGFFSDRLEVVRQNDNGDDLRDEDTISGVQAGLGFGYNFEHVYLEFELNPLKSSSDYSSDVDTAYSGSLSIGARF